MLEEPVQLAIENLTSAIVNEITLPNDENTLHLEKATNTQGEPRTKATHIVSTLKHLLDNMEMGLKRFHFLQNAREKELEKHPPENPGNSHNEQDLHLQKGNLCKY